MISHSDQPKTSRAGAVVVGGGLGGLVAACLLARAGEDVLLLERSDSLGGQVKQVRGDGWSWDNGHYFSGDSQPFGLLPRILDACGAQDVRFERLAGVSCDIRVDGFEYAMPTDRVEYEDSLLRLFPSSSSGLEKYFRFLRETEDFNAGSQGNTLQPLPLRMLRNPLFTRYAQRPFASLASSTTDDPLLQLLMCPHHWAFRDTPEEMSCNLVADIQNHLLRSGVWRVPGGFSRIAHALTSAFVRFGGSVCTGVEVEHVDVRNRCVRGVQWHHRQSGARGMVATGTVISNADILRTAHEYVGLHEFPDSRQSKLRDPRYSLSAVYLHLGFDLPREALQRYEYPQLHFDSPRINQHYQTLRRGTWPTEHVFTAWSPSAGKGGDDRVPSGFASLTIEATAPGGYSVWGLSHRPGDSLESLAAQAESQSYRDQREAVEARLLDSLDRLDPSLRSRLVLSRLVTPIDTELEMAATGGASLGPSGTVESYRHNRPGARTGIFGLYLCGSGTRPGYVPAGAISSGVLAASAVLGGGLKTMLRT